MMIKLSLKLLASFSLLLVFTFFSASSAMAAPKLYLDPTTKSVTKDNEFSISLKIDAESNQVVGSDTTLNYAGNEQEIVGIDNGGYFPELSWANNGSGKLEIHTYSTSIYQAKTGSGTLAVLKFKAKKDSGSSTITFHCTNSGNDTNIVNNDGQNILSCSNLNQVSINYTGSTSSPNPSASPSPSASAPTNIAPVCEELTISPSSAVGFPQTVTFNCKGRDSDNQITAAEFRFGDGSEPYVVSNTIGSSGYLATTHTFTKTGTFNLECRLRDRIDYSNTCRQTLTIKPLPVASATPRPKASIVPGGKVLSLVEDAPSPTPTATPLASIVPESEKESNSTQSKYKILLWLIPILLGLGLIYYVFRPSKTTSPEEEY